MIKSGHKRFRKAKITALYLLIVDVFSLKNSMLFVKHISASVIKHWTSVASANRKSPKKRFTSKNFVKLLCLAQKLFCYACSAVTATVATISSTLQPRLRSFNGFAKP